MYKTLQNLAPHSAFDMKGAKAAEDNECPRWGPILQQIVRPHWLVALDNYALIVKLCGASGIADSGLGVTQRQPKSFCSASVEGGELTITQK